MKTLKECTSGYRKYPGEYPKPDGGVFRVLGIGFFDPSGYFCEVNQFV